MDDCDGEGLLGFAEHRGRVAWCGGWGQGGMSCERFSVLLNEDSINRCHG